MSFFNVCTHWAHSGVKLCAVSERKDRDEGRERDREGEIQKEQREGDYYRRDGDEEKGIGETE